MLSARHRGFSLLEAVTGLALAAILATIAVPVLRDQIDRSHATERMLAMRAYMRAKTVDGLIDQSIAERVGLTGSHIEDMYQIMAIANYEDRFVIPTAHRELGEDAYDLRGSCGFSADGVPREGVGV